MNAELLSECAAFLLDVERLLVLLDRVEDRPFANRVYHELEDTFRARDSVRAHLVGDHARVSSSPDR